tara:strand:+ start:183 stop:443 length:261 start_codon:yes stop_codon:yes gene_type:complete
MESDLEIAPFKGINKERNIKIVNNTTICAIALFSFFNPGLKTNKIIPKMHGIKEVIDPSTPQENKKEDPLQSPNIINVILFKRFDL